MGRLIPSGAERQHLGRFYLATFLAEITHLAMPFQVVLVVRYVGKAELGVVLFIEQLISMLLEIPSGAWADRFGRKRCVIIGHVIEAVGWMAIPAATLVASEFRLAAMSAAFGLLGCGAALVSGAHEAWVVDNLKFEHRKELILRFFGRERSLASAGGMLADVAAFAVVAWVDIRLFWVLTGIGQLASIAVLWRIPEHSPETHLMPFEGGSTEPAISHTPQHGRETIAAEADEENEDEEDEDFDEPEVTIREAIRDGLAAIVRRPALLAFTVLLLWFEATNGLSAEAYLTALDDADLHDRGFAALEFGIDGVGALAPLAALWLVPRLGAKRMIGFSLLAVSAIALAVYHGPGQFWLAGAYLFSVSVTAMLHTVTDDYQQQLLASSTRATASSAINLLISGASLGSSVWLAFLLGYLPATTAVAVMGLAALPATLLLIPRFRATEAYS